MNIHAIIKTTDGDSISKLFSGWPAMMAYITEHWKMIKEFKAKVESNGNDA